MSQIKPGLEPAAQESVEATANPPYLFEWSMRIWPIPFANGVGFRLAEDVAASCGGGFDGVGVAKGVDHDEVMADPLVAHRGHGDALRRQFARRTPSPRSDSPKTQGENMPTFTGATTVPFAASQIDLEQWLFTPPASDRRACSGCSVPRRALPRRV
jgi:hypothetical protein